MNEQTFRVEYNSNNSGGDWWLADEDWQKLEAAGWTVAWLGHSFCHARYSSLGRGRPAPETCPTEEDCPGHSGADSYDEALAAGFDARFLGALAQSATIEITAYSESLAEGVAAEWWRDTLGMDPHAPGCSCCGQPHSFYARPKERVAA